MKKAIPAVRVGLFATIAIALMIGLVVILGSQQSLFARKVRLYTSFENISGLIVGTPVRLAGIDVGTVEEIQFSKDLSDKQVHVVLGINNKYLDRIREDSFARLSSKGLLGDMIVNITVGSADLPPLHDKATLKSRETEGLTEIVSSVQDAVTGIKSLSLGLNERMKAALTDKVISDFGHLVHSIAMVAGQVEKGGGLAHQLIYEKKMADDTAAAMASAKRIGASADHILQRVDTLLGEKQVDKIVVNVADISKKLSDILGDIQHGDGMAHALIYEKDHENLIANFTELSKVLRKVGEDLDQGKGTLGGLLKDPTVYQDLKIILGNIKRNRLLRALVQYTIKKDGLNAPSSEK